MSVIWVIDDSIVVRKILQVSLEREGHTVQSFGTGLDAARLVPAPEAAPYWSAPDLVLVDLYLPGWDGYDVIRWSKSHPFFQRTRFVVISCRDSVLDRLKARLSGAEAYITKPFRTQEVLVLVQEVLAQRQVTGL